MRRQGVFRTTTVGTARNSRGHYSKPIQFLWELDRLFLWNIVVPPKVNYSAVISHQFDDRHVDDY